MSGADHPAVKDGVRLAAITEGTYLEHAGRGFVLRGRGLHPLIARMLSALDGRQAPATIDAALPEPARRLFRTLLDRLDAAAMLTSGPPGAIADDHPHADTVRYLREATPDWRAWFTTWTTRPITIDAPSTIAALLARRLAECGAGVVIDAASSTHEGLLIGVEDGAARQARRAPGGRFDGCLVARPYAGGAIMVGRRDGDVDAAWRAIAASEGGGSLTPLSRETLSALLAFEALWSCAPDSAERGARAAFTDVRVLRADGGVARHPAAIAAASRRIDVDASRRVVPPSPAYADWFDPAVGPFERVDDDRAPYPLAHCSLLVRAGAAAGSMVRGWGLDADDAETAAVEQAIALFESRRAGWSPAVGRSPVIVAADDDSLRAQAGALARVSLPGYATGRRRSIAAEEVPGRDARTLLRLLRRYTGCWPTLWSIAAGPAIVAWAQVDGREAVGISTDPENAWTGALGDLMSEIQLNVSATRQASWPITAWRGAPLPGEDATSPAIDRHCRIVRLTGEHLRGLSVGYAEVAPT